MHLSRRLACLTLAVSMMFLGLGCGSKVSGVYYREFPGISGVARHEWDFRSGGTVLWKQRYGNVVPGTYKVANGTITAEYKGESGTFTYRIEGSDLVDKDGNRLRRMQ